MMCPACGGIYDSSFGNTCMWCGESFQLDEFIDEFDLDYEEDEC